MCFFSLVSGIITMGNPKQLHQVGKQVMFTLWGALAVAIIFVGGMAALVVPFSETELAQVSGFFLSLWTMLLHFVPTNIVSAFADKRMMQIILIAAAFGIAIIYMRDELDSVARLVLALEKLFGALLRFICSFEAILIFLGLLKVFLEGFTELSHVAYIVIGAHIVAYAAVFLGISIVLARIASGHTLRILKKMMGPAVIALTTASSTAAFPETLSTCERGLGIQHRLVAFAVPFGQVVFKMGSGIRLFLMTLLCMYFYQVPIDMFAILLLGFLAYLLSMMVPPVAEGGVAALTLLFTYMKVPVDALAIALILSVFLDFFSSFINVYSNQVFILKTALRLKMVDKETLYK